MFLIETRAELAQLHEGRVIVDANGVYYCVKSTRRPIQPTVFSRFGRSTPVTPNEVRLPARVVGIER